MRWAGLALETVLNPARSGGGVAGPVALLCQVRNREPGAVPADVRIRTAAGAGVHSGPLTGGRQERSARTTLDSGLPENRSQRIADTSRIAQLEFSAPSQSRPVT